MGKLSKRKREQIEGLWKAGRNVSEIAEAMKLSERTIRGYLASRLKTKKPPKKKNLSICNENPNCKKCRYRASLGSYGIHCNYIILKGHSRGCPVDGCTRFEKGEAIREKVKIIVGGRA